LLITFSLCKIIDEGVQILKLFKLKRMESFQTHANHEDQGKTELIRRRFTFAMILMTRTSKEGQEDPQSERLG